MKKTKTRKETLCFLLRRNEQTQKLQVLMGLKTQKTGAGKWNGYGGGKIFWETLKSAAKREIYEELGVVVELEDLQQRGYLKITTKKTEGLTRICKLTIFVASKWSGDFCESNEMKTPTWYDIDDLPDLISTDSTWLPNLLKGYGVDGEIKEDHYFLKNIVEKHWLGWPI